MTCPRCSTELPTGAAFCHRCGADAVWANATDGGRRHSYAAQPGEGVVSFNVVSVLMPLARSFFISASVKGSGSAKTDSGPVCGAT